MVGHFPLMEDDRFQNPEEIPGEQMQECPEVNPQICLQHMLD
jgi:hypothetical protein